MQQPIRSPELLDERVRHYKGFGVTFVRGKMIKINLVSPNSHLLRGARFARYGDDIVQSQAVSHKPVEEPVDGPNPFPTQEYYELCEFLENEALDNRGEI